MKRDNKTKYALLGVLSQYEGSGYDIKKFIEVSIGYFWKESFGQIYPNLKKLETEGLITSRSVTDQKGSNKIIYNITDTGRAKLKSWLKLPVENANYRNELLLKLFFGSQMSPQDILSHLGAKKNTLEKTLKEYKKIEKNLVADGYQTPDQPFWLITLNYGIRSTKAELEWINTVQENIKTKFKGGK
ncbi:MAG: PadR family transcriptional regulator [Spirochaetia bacterium]|nr:PadR family transcriptional regulator [Spirochaetia bacterium]